MEITKHLRFEFDEDSRILHLRGTRFVGITTEERLTAVMEAIRAEMRRHSGSGRMYMIIDVTNLVIPPELSQSYGRLAADIYTAYAFPNGVARFGHQITRLAVRRGYMDFMEDDPHIFGTRAEAEAYIRSLIVRRQAKKESSATPEVTPEYSSND
ncbi:MAG: hypothetical protein GYA46_01860 [candidate division Zixibacteria bacterium]|nr:hypothetical protein [candidate division Zixibacteria bacterium]